MRAIDADKLGEVKFHSLPYTHITPSDVEAESYKRGWNDAIDSIIENAPTIETERKKGMWIKRDVPRQIHGISCSAPNYQCSVCKKWWFHNGEGLKWDKFCPECGADMRGDDHDL